MSLLGRAFSGIAKGIYIAIGIVRRATVKVKNALASFHQASLRLMNNIIDKLEGRIEGELQGAAHFFRKMGDLFQEGTKNYSLDEEMGEWKETVVTRNVTKGAIPESYLDRLYGYLEVNDTRELQNSLEY